MEEAASSVIVTNPVHPYTKALLAASPRFGSHYSKERLIVIPGRVADPEGNLGSSEPRRRVPANPEPGCPFAPLCADATDQCRKAIPPEKVTVTHNFRCVRGVL